MDKVNVIQDNLTIKGPKFDSINFKIMQENFNNKMKKIN